jgi:adenine-specific DNA-methyltransferase
MAILYLTRKLGIRDAEELQKLDVSKLKSPKKKIDFKSNKWTFYFLDQKEIDFLERLQTKKIIPKLGDYAKVEVGITTGSNPFFTVEKLCDTLLPKLMSGEVKVSIDG